MLDKEMRERRNRYEHLAWTLADNGRSRIIMRRYLAAVTGLPYRELDGLAKGELATLFAEHRAGNLTPKQIITEIALGKYLWVDGWKSRFQACKTALFNLLEWQTDMTEFSVRDMRAFGAPSECLDVVFKSLQWQVTERRERIFDRAHIHPVLFWAILEWQLEKASRRMNYCGVGEPPREVGLLYLKA